MNNFWLSFDHTLIFITNCYIKFAANRHGLEQFLCRPEKLQMLDWFLRTLAWDLGRHFFFVAASICLWFLPKTKIFSNEIQIKVIKSLYKKKVDSSSPRNSMIKLFKKIGKHCNYTLPYSTPHRVISYQNCKMTFDQYLTRYNTNHAINRPGHWVPRVSPPIID